MIFKIIHITHGTKLAHLGHWKIKLPQAFWRVTSFGHFSIQILFGIFQIRKNINSLIIPKYIYGKIMKFWDLNLNPPPLHHLISGRDNYYSYSLFIQSKIILISGLILLWGQISRQEEYSFLLKFYEYFLLIKLLFKSV